MTKISQLSSIGDSLAVGDQFLIRDIDDAGSPNKSVTVSGITRALDLGTAAAPAIAFATDKNSGIFSPGADQVAISTNGTGRLFVDASGRVGVGESSPGRTLVIKDTGAAYLLIQESTQSDGLEIFTDSSNAAQIVNRLNGTLGFATNNITRLRLDATGLLRYVGGGSLASPAVSFNGSAPTNSLVIDSSGRLGLGTSSPGKTLDVNGEARFSTAATVNNGAAWYTAGDPGGYLYLGNGIGNPASIETYSPTSRGSSAELALRFKTVSSAGSAATAMTIDSSQRVGIGTTTPTFNLQSIGTAPAFFGQSVNNGTQIGYTDSLPTNSFNCFVGWATEAIGGVNGDLALVPRSSTGAKILFFTGSTTPTQRAQIDSSGRLLIGTSTARSNFYNSTISSRFLIEGANDGTIGRNSAFVYGAASGAGPLITLAKHRSNSIGGTTVVNSGDQLGGIFWQGSDGTEFVEGASITAEVDGTPDANDMPGRLVFSTTADGSASPTERMRINSGGTTTLTSAAATSPFRALISTAEVARIDSGGRLLLGTSTVRNVGSGFAPQFQLESPNSGIAGLTVVTNRGDGIGPSISLAKSRGASVGSTTIVADGDALGELRFCGADGTDIETMGARISASVDGTPGANDMPGRLTFLTTADGSASPTERLSITSAGVLQIADAGNITVGTTTGTKIGTATTQKLGFYNATPVVQPAAVADATTAVDVITQLNDLLAKLRTLGIIAT